MTPSPRPLLGLDVDGPLYPWDNKNHRRPTGFVSYRLTRHGFYTGRDFHRYKGKRVWLNPEHGPMLTSLAERAGLEMIWLTSWEHDANAHIGPAIGLPPLPVVEFPGNQVDGWARNGWKWDNVLHATEGRPLAWIDDDFEEPWNKTNRDRFLDARGDTPTLLHPINPKTGLTDDDMTTIGRWAATLEGCAA
jgi:hypothetical protein